MNRTEALEYLTRCADDSGNHWYEGRVWEDVETCPTCHGTDDAGHLQCPGSRYGRYSSDVAPIAYRHAVWFSHQTGEPITRDALDHSMSLAVNDDPDIETDLHAYAAELAGANVDAMVEGYLDCQLWAQRDWDRADAELSDVPTLDEHYDREDISDEYVEQVRAEFAALVYAHPLAVRMYLEHRLRPTYGVESVYFGHESAYAYFGHDFYLTREGHGAGFWDRGLGELGDYLTQISKWAGSADDLSDNGDGVLQ